MKKLGLILFSAVLITSCAKKEQTPPPAESAPAPVAQKPTQEQVMEAWKKFSTTGAEHKELLSLVGNWKADSVFQLSPGSATDKATAVVKREKALEGKFLKETYASKDKEHPFNGVGMLGFDTARGVYVSSWFDTMSTGVATGEGKVVSSDAAGKVLEFTNQATDPVTGKVKSSKSRMTILSKDKTTYEMLETDSSGKEFKTLEIVYTRRK